MHKWSVQYQADNNKSESAILKQKLTIKTTRKRMITGAHFASRASTAKTN
jgi:hypothetical protein